SGKVESVVASGTEGYFQILPGHTPFLSTLQIGEMRIKIDGKDDYYATSGGFAEVHADKVTILAETAEHAHAIDIERANASKARAKKFLEDQPDNIDPERARLSLFRAVNRIRTHSRI
ncbi:ATP synthase F1 subunit epsilon, partial [candidate division KSB1 bacterium]|nr:ATP synthase F1 subunit epsilon [candidate division KSB1 bacterium]